MRSNILKTKMKKYITVLVITCFVSLLMGQAEVDSLRTILIQNEQRLDSIFGEDIAVVNLYSGSIDTTDLIGVAYPFSEVLKLKEFKKIVEGHPGICPVSDGGIVVLKVIKQQDFLFEMIQIQSMYFGALTLIIECFVNGENIFIGYACGKKYMFEEIKALRKRGENLTNWK
ncbi:MAG: hypothetical protein Sapg2KO_14330 [Saprospiraceae bacterium]